MTARDDDLDDPFIARYADRVDDDTEVLWRADFARLTADPRLPELQAAEIRARWSTDTEVGPRWRELDEIYSAWSFAPEAMRRAHEVSMPGGVQPPDMDSTRWSSHMQARELAAEGYWPGFEPTFSTDVSERHEPMTDTTDRSGPAEAEQWRPEGSRPRELTEWERDLLDQAAHVLDSETETETEREMRTDYERYSQLHRGDPNEYDPADSLDASEYASTWLDHEDYRYGDEWVAISKAEELWRTDPDAAAVRLADTSTAPVQRRTLEQARDMSRGIYARDVNKVVDRVTGTADSSSPIPAPAPVERPMTHFDNGLPSWDASRNNPARPVPQFAGVTSRTSALANYKPGNALAAAMERQAERAGAER